MFEDVALAITGLGAIIAAIAGVLLVIHSVRGKERKASDDEIRDLSTMLDEARHEVVEAKKREHAINMWLAERGMDPPP